MWDNLKVDGFQFNNSADYAEAKHESEAISYIESKMDISNPRIALKVYYKLLDRKNLHTIVGITYMKQLRNFCISSGLVSDEQIRAIDIFDKNLIKGAAAAIGDETALETDSLISESETSVDKSFDEYDSENKKALQQENTEDNEKKELKRSIQTYISRENKLKTVAEHYRSKMKKCYLVIATLIVIIVAIFAITIYRGGMPYDDVEAEIQNKYAAWEEELEIREKALSLQLNEAGLNPEE